MNTSRATLPSSLWNLQTPWIASIQNRSSGIGIIRLRGSLGASAHSRLPSTTTASFAPASS
ncbi:MAG: hypothetical protein WKG01_18080 [Kofleriaceae bacterium]